MPHHSDEPTWAYANFIENIEDANTSGLDYIGGQILGIFRKAEVEMDMATDFGKGTRLPNGDLSIGRYTKVESDESYRQRLIDWVCAKEIGHAGECAAACSHGPRPTGEPPRSVDVTVKGGDTIHYGIAPQTGVKFCVALVDKAPNPACHIRMERPDGFSQDRIDQIKVAILATVPKGRTK